VNQTTRSPIRKEFNPMTDADELILFQLTQALPIFVIYVK